MGKTCVHVNVYSPGLYCHYGDPDSVTYEWILKFGRCRGVVGRVVPGARLRHICRGRGFYAGGYSVRLCLLCARYADDQGSNGVGGGCGLSGPAEQSRRKGSGRSSFRNPGRVYHGSWIFWLCLSPSAKRFGGCGKYSRELGTGRRRNCCGNGGLLGPASGGASSGVVEGELI